VVADEKIIDRIAKLLALGRDEAATEHERENAMRRAQRLMSKHQLEMDAFELNLDSAAGRQAVAKLFRVHLGYDDRLIALALKQKGGRAMIEHLIRRLSAEEDIYPREILARIAGPYRLEVAAIIDTVGSERLAAVEEWARSAEPRPSLASARAHRRVAFWPRLLCEYCGDFKPTRRRRDSRFCSANHQQAAAQRRARRRAAGLSEDAPGGRGHAFERAS